MALGVAACTGPADLDVEDAWVRLPAVPGRPAAAYFTVQGGPEPRTLIRVTADLAVRAEMHETMSGMGSGGGHMSMRPITAVPIPAGQEVAFEPGGRHVMLFDLDRRAKPGATTLLTLTFDDGQRLYRKAWIASAASQTPD
ncbi:hypothetical protein CKY28_01175 [Sphingomonas lenta]|uniref:Copper chaperone PCu(A)C n=2 Tax=Sphingomonas lenta TaxID=1141887 RepID=A0A2A2SJI0_9SPHN|nr:hypothetical protein CKY28_01175 [Sphingomonas lenta]